MSDVTMTVEEKNKGRPAILEQQAAQFPPPGTVPLVVELDLGKKIYGAGFGLSVRRIAHVDPSAEAQAAATADSIARFEDALVRNTEKIRQFLAGTLVEVTDVSKWDPSGRAYYPREKATAVAPPLASPLSTAPKPAVINPPTPVTLPALEPAPAKSPPPAIKMGPPAIKIGR